MSATPTPAVHRHGVACDVDYLSLLLGVALGAAQQQGRVVLHFLKQVSHLQGGQLGPPENPVVDYGEQGAVAQLDQPVARSLQLALTQRPDQAVPLPPAPPLPLRCLRCSAGRTSELLSVS